MTARWTELRRRIAHLATARETVAAFVVLAAVWTLGFVGVLPKEVWVPAFPALAGAMLVDTFAFNELGVAEQTLFYPALAACGYIEAMVVGAAVRRVARRRGGDAGGERPATDTEARVPSAPVSTRRGGGDERSN